MCPPHWLQYLSAVLLLRALRRSRVPPRLHLPTGNELRSLSGTFGILTVFYAAKNFSYLLLQASHEAGPGVGGRGTRCLLQRWPACPALSRARGLSACSNFFHSPMRLPATA